MSARQPNRRLWHDPHVRLGLMLVIALYAIAFLAPLLTPYDPTAQLDLQQGRLLGPSPAHPLGTDGFSRDLLSRLLYGARFSLTIAGLAVAVALVIGTGVGLIAGYAGGWVDGALMRLVDAALAIPRVFLLLMVLVFWENTGATALILVLGLTGWFVTSRVVRAEVLSVRQRDYVVAAHALGLPVSRILTRHVLPNVAAPIIVSATVGVANVLLMEAGLSFLGLGAPPPLPSWGSMIFDGHDYLATHPWLSVVPGLALVGTVAAFNLLGEGLRRALDVRSR